MAFPLALSVIGGAVMMLNLGGAPKTGNSISLRPVWLGLLAAWLIGSVINIRITTPLWGSELALWTWAAQKHDDFPFVKVNYVNALLEAGRLAEVEQELKKPIDPKYLSPGAEFRIELAKAQLELRQGHMREAWELLKDMKPATEKVIDELAKSGIDYRNYSLPRTSQLGVASDVTFYNVRAEVLLGLRKYEEALIELQKAAFINPNNYGSGLLMAFSLYGLNRNAEAERVFLNTKSKMTLPMQKDAERLRSQLFTQLCRGAVSPCENSDLMFH